MTSYDAAGKVEGFVECDSFQDYIEAIAQLIKDGSAWTLQGFFGRTCQSWIDAKLVDNAGNLDQDAIDEYVMENTIDDGDDEDDDDDYWEDDEDN